MLLLFKTHFEWNVTKFHAYSFVQRFQIGIQSYHKIKQDWRKGTDDWYPKFEKLVELERTNNNSTAKSKIEKILQTQLKELKKPTRIETELPTKMVLHFRLKTGLPAEQGFSYPGNDFV